MRFLSIFNFAIQKNQHDQSGGEQCADDPDRAVNDALFQHLPPGLDKGNILKPRQYPEFAAPDPQLVDHDPVIPVHHFKEQQRLQICRFKLRDAVPRPDDPQQHHEHHKVKRRHKALALAVDRCAVGKADRDRALLHVLRVKVKSVDRAAADGELHHHSENEAV